MQRSSLWCFTNLIAAGRKSLKVLMSQELITGLIIVSQNTHSQDIKNDAYSAIELVIDQSDQTTFS